MSVTPESPSQPIGLSRRTMLQRAAVAGLVATPAAGLLAACADSGSGDEGTSNSGTVSATNPLGIPEDKPINVVIFNGGYGDKYATDVHEPMYQKAFPKSEVKHQSSQAISTLVQPLIAGGNPPEFVNNSGEKMMDFGALVADGQLHDLTPLLDAPSVDDPNKKVRDTLMPGTIEAGSFNGKPYVLYYVSTVYGIWYSGKLFTDKGWKPATTWSEFTALCEEIKKAGVAPYAYAGANAAYYQWNIILTSAAKIGGADILKNIDNLEDGAWKVDAVKQAAEAWAEIGAKYNLQGAEGLKHTDVQLKQNQYQLAMYPSGDWLENEQKKDTPADFKYQLMTTPSVTTSDKLKSTALRAAAGEGYVVLAKSRNPKGGLEYMRQMLSKAGGKGFTETVKAPTVVQGSTQGLTFTPGIQSSQDALKAAGQEVFNLYFDGWYKDLDKEARTATNELMFGRIKADAFVERIQKKADEIKKDSSVTKFKR
ncbi:N-acetylglucosamine/diacetylchitobiose ABC transporter substrate-binding protein [Dactylosporangium roseum]|uniref:N-acetylglucosamine/diacetylchitobiose ABC transporter substrate-binding protein n=1 Tax=Dactylosporangium roseum TaxID=47989 RepID=A0ABY5Z921_9ACTN|nr:N-acetylglucosamine/diacetylchitobiose ABC transporter substrate-binding protein [Dactylosporangium roseum]UWZ38531.1 N-acetylglucosamine/diacetylchitobiose ABC transporter substrate-binding protein [Dactylosporangium roseum]